MGICLKDISGYTTIYSENLRKILQFLNPKVNRRVDPVHNLGKRYHILAAISGYQITGLAPALGKAS